MGLRERGFQAGTMTGFSYKSMEVRLRSRYSLLRQYVWVAKLRKAPLSLNHSAASTSFSEINEFSFLISLKSLILDF